MAIKNEWYEKIIIIIIICVRVIESIGYVYISLCVSKNSWDYFRKMELKIYYYNTKRETQIK